MYARKINGANNTTYPFCSPTSSLGSPSRNHDRSAFSHAEPFPEIHLYTSPAHLVKVKSVKCFRLAHGEDVAPTPRSPLSEVVDVILSVRLRTAFHGRDGGRSNHLHIPNKKNMLHAFLKTVWPFRPCGELHFGTLVKRSGGIKHQQKNDQLNYSFHWVKRLSLKASGMALLHLAADVCLYFPREIPVG